MKRNTAIGESVQSHIKKSLKKESFADLFTQEHIKYEIAQIVKKHREKSGLTQKQLADLTGIKQSAISRIESRKTTYIPSIELLRKIFIPLGYNISYHVDRLKKAA